MVNKLAKLIYIVCYPKKGEARLRLVHRVLTIFIFLWTLGVLIFIIEWQELTIPRLEWYSIVGIIALVVFFKVKKCFGLSDFYEVDDEIFKSKRIIYSFILAFIILISALSIPIGFVLGGMLGSGVHFVHP